MRLNTRRLRAVSRDELAEAASCFRRGDWTPLGFDFEATARRALGVRAFGLEGEALDKFCKLPAKLTGKAEAEQVLADRRARKAEVRAWLESRGIGLPPTSRGESRLAIRQAEWCRRFLPGLRAARDRIRARGGKVTVSALARETGRNPVNLFNALRPGHYLSAYRAELLGEDGA